MSVFKPSGFEWMGDLAQGIGAFFQSKQMLEEQEYIRKQRELEAKLNQQKLKLNEMAMSEAEAAAKERERLKPFTLFEEFKARGYKPDEAAQAVGEAGYSLGDIFLKAEKPKAAMTEEERVAGREGSVWQAIGQGPRETGQLPVQQGGQFFGVPTPFVDTEGQEKAGKQAANAAVYDTIRAMVTANPSITDDQIRGHLGNFIDPTTVNPNVIGQAIVAARGEAEAATAAKLAEQQHELTIWQAKEDYQFNNDIAKKNIDHGFKLDEESAKILMERGGVMSGFAKSGGYVGYGESGGMPYANRSNNILAMNYNDYWADYLGSKGFGAYKTEPLSQKGGGSAYGMAITGDPIEAAIAALSMPDGKTKSPFWWYKNAEGHSLLSSVPNPAAFAALPREQQNAIVAQIYQRESGGHSLAQDYIPPKPDKQQGPTIDPQTLYNRFSQSTAGAQALRLQVKSVQEKVNYYRSLLAGPDMPPIISAQGQELDAKAAIQVSLGQTQAALNELRTQLLAAEADELSWASEVNRYINSGGEFSFVDLTPAEQAALARAEGLSLSPPEFGPQPADWDTAFEES